MTPQALTGYKDLIGLVLLLVLCGCSTPAEWSRVYEGYLPGTEPENVSVTVVRDARTGAPLPGVKVRQFLEDIAPRTCSAPFVTEAETDDFGIVSIAWKDEPRNSHWIFEKPGFAVENDYGAMADPRIDLHPGRTMHGRLLDPFGKAYAGVEVEFFLGCGHGPALRRTTTDTEGRFLFRDIDPVGGMLWFPADRLEADYTDVLLGTPDHPFPVTPDPGRVVRGTVVNENGEAVAGAVVRGRNEFRGPTAMTAQDGAFRLTGLGPRTHFTVHGSGKDYAWIDGTSIDTGRPLRIVVRPTEENDGREDWKAEEVEVRFKVVDAVSGAPVPDVSVYLHRPGDGRVFWADPSENGCIQAPPGAYFLRAGDATESHVAPPRPFTVRKGDESEHRILARRRPKLELALKNLPDKEVLLDLVLRQDVVPIHPGKTGPHHLPAEGAAALRVRAEKLVRLYPVGPLREGKRRAEVAWPDRKRIRVDIEGKQELYLCGAWSTQTGDSVLKTHAAGRATLVVRHKTLGTQEIQVDIPETPGVEIRVERAALRAPGTVEICHADGTPLVDHPVEIDGEPLCLDRKGRVVSWLVRPGARVKVKFRGRVPLRKTLQGKGPFRIAWGRARLEIHLAEHLDFTVYLDGELYEGKSGRLDLAGLDTGKHTVIVAARSRRGRAMGIVLTEGEARRIDLQLERK